MNCDETQKLVHAYVDGELDLMTNLRIEQHLLGCSECSQLYKSQQEMHDGLSAGALYYHAPATLEKSIRASIRKAGRPEAAPFVMPRRLLAVAMSVAAVLIAAVGIWALLRTVPAPASDTALAQEVVSSHIRSLMGNHLEDVASTDQHTVKPWFDGKLDFSPPVSDFSAQGFPLVGGRLDYLDGRPVAALVYGRHKHFINLFIWPQTGNGDVGTETTALQGYQVYHWTKSGMTFWAVSDVNSADLGQFVQLVQNGAEPTEVR